MAVAGANRGEDVNKNAWLIWLLTYKNISDYLKLSQQSCLVLR
jgi:hypothetical protein